MLVNLVLFAAVTAAECAEHAATSCEEGDGAGLMQVSRARKVASVNVRVCGFAGVIDPEAAVAPTCAKGFNDAMTAGCRPGLYQMFIIFNETSAYCAYTGGWALQGYAGQGCTKETFFTMPGQDGPLFFDNNNEVTTLDGTPLTQFTGLKEDYSSRFSCNSGTCKYTKSGPWISIRYSGHSNIPIGTVPEIGVSFTWDANSGPVMFARYDATTSRDIQAMDLKNEGGNVNGFTVQGSNIDTCNSIVNNWPITGVAACTQNGDVYAPILSTDVTLNC